MDWREVGPTQRGAWLPRTPAALPVPAAASVPSPLARIRNERFVVNWTPFVMGSYRILTSLFLKAGNRSFGSLQEIYFQREQQIISV
jgi:hypothetical protein